MFRNPIITGFNPDPSICFADGTYYIVTSTFEYFPGVTIWESKDLMNWTYCDSVLKTASHLDLDKSPDSLGLYAATLRYHGGRFYMVTTNKYLKSNFVVKDCPPPKGKDCNDYLLLLLATPKPRRGVR